MIITITLNPALDKTIHLSNFQIDEVNRADDVRIDAAGKGINVSKVIKELNGESIALGIIGGENGNFIKTYLDTNKIENDFNLVDENTRVNLKIVDQLNNTFTDINEKGSEIKAKEIEDIKTKILKYAKSGDIVVLAGSVPPGFTNEIYKELIELVQKNGAKVILDASNELFVEGIKSAPYLVKPNVDELESSLNIKIETEAEIVAAAKQIINRGVSIVVVSNGSKGSIFVTKDYSLLAKGLKVDVKSTVGAGDSMVAAIAFSLENKYSLEEMMKLSAAVSTANVMTEGTQTGDLKIINEFKEKIEIIQI